MTMTTTTSTCEKDNTTATATATAATTATAAAAATRRTSPPNSITVGLTKKQRGRLKKLRKRSQQVKLEGCETSGIASPSDWIECQQLLALTHHHRTLSKATTESGEAQAATTPTVGPSVWLRQRQRRQVEDKTDDECWQTAEGCVHRDILWNMLLRFATSTSSTSSPSSSVQKRKRCSNDDSTCDATSTSTTTIRQRQRRIPQWCTLHNPCTVQSVAVIELCLAEKNYTTEILREHLPVLFELLVGNNNNQNDDNDNKDDYRKRKVALPIRTRWFQGPVAKSPADILMYDNDSSTTTAAAAAAAAVPTRPSKRGRRWKSNDDDDETTEQDSDETTEQQQDEQLQTVVNRLLKLVLSRKQQQKEGFPIVVMDDTTSSSSSSSLSSSTVQKDRNAIDHHSNGAAAIPTSSTNPTTTTTTTSLHQQQQLQLPPLDRAIEIVNQYKVSLPVVVRNEKRTPSSSDNDTFVMAATTTISDTRTASPLPNQVVIEQEKQSLRRRRRRVFALDCEMVQTTKGIELARVTVLELSGCCWDDPTNDDDVHDKNNNNKDDDVVSYAVVLDELVRPYERILDYCTEYSGITPTILEGITTRIEQVQAVIVSSLLDGNDILVGHSLENDLLALRLVHDNVVDTAMLFRARKKGRKYSLRHLSFTLLGKSIQSNHGVNGHCSEEDAATALQLAVRRAQEGPSFRIKERGDDTIHLLNCIHQGQKGSNRDGSGPVVVVCCVGPLQWLQQHVTAFPNSAHALTCETIDDPNRKAVVSWLTNPKRRAALAWARLQGGKNEGNASVLQKANKFLTELLERMLPGTLVLVCIQSNYVKALEGAKQRKTCMDPRSSLGWTTKQEEDFQRLVDDCRSGHVFWIGDCPS